MSELSERANSKRAKWFSDFAPRDEHRTDAEIIAVGLIFPNARTTISAVAAAPAAPTAAADCDENEEGEFIIANHFGR